MLRTFCAREVGQGLVEYALLLALVAIALVGALTLMSGQLNGLFGSIISALDNVAK